MDDDEQPFRASRRFSRENALKAFREIAPHKKEYLLEAKAYRSTIQYASVWRGWKRWREEKGLAAMPATPEQLEEWVWYLIEDKKMSPASIDSYIAAVATVHRYHGYSIDRTLPIEPLKAARRLAGPPRRARALLGDKLQGLVATIDPAEPRGCRDALMMLLGWAMAGRSAELTGLGYLRPGGRAYGGTGFLSRETRGLLVTLLTSKGSQITPKELAIPYHEMPSLSTWLDRWLEHAKVQGGEPIFRPIDPVGRIQRARLAADSVAKIVRKRMLDHTTASGLSEADARACWITQPPPVCRRPTLAPSAAPSAPTACAAVTARRPPTRVSRSARSARDPATPPTPSSGSTSRVRRAGTAAASMASASETGLRITTSTKDARAFAAVTLGDGTPLVPHDAHGQGPGAVVAAVLNRLADMKHPRAAVLYHCPSSTSPQKGPQP